ncbi:hypothetical protein CYLTODRAFT_422027 [Cylindrobasidium torrendii FP15055 ss-10]|uniref:Uncharacterized protein n=1 Tax=Cylindrobasidium torrendii FP15055 ss-10 TaxID=1314674 RepID=A0A0D7BBS7_9AGAR|nr:hypothetical protein CYLTODRAFT_422027 [Cylindrobasidium torrendii FP15055 ss-10]
MKRAQSMRNQHAARPSLALISDDLGVLREGNESNEDVLRKQLLDKDRECDRLKTQVQQLQAQLASRPPLDQVQELQKEYKDLDLLLQGTMRENERSMLELERYKTREKMLEQKLAQLAGENWAETLDMPHNSSTISLASPRRPAPTKRTDSQPQEEDKGATLARLDQIKFMIMGMEQRMEIRKEKLSKNMAEAREKEHKYEDLAAQASHR